MHYYQFNIGDYTSHTSHLDLIEDIAYRRMLDWYYNHEKPLPLDVQEIARQIRMRDHATAIRDVLTEFFTQTEDGWVSDRVEREIAHFKAKIEQASRAGKASAQRRLNGRSTDVQPTNNHKPITNNQINTPSRKREVDRPSDVSEAVWLDFLQQRKALKAPLSETALQSIVKEASKAGWTLQDALQESVARGWRSFKAEWVTAKTQSTNFLGGI